MKQSITTVDPTRPSQARCGSTEIDGHVRVTVGGGFVRRFEVNTIGGRSPLLQFDGVPFKEFEDT